MIVNKDKAIALLQSEQIVALPTETVYGLAGNIYSDKAIKAIFDTKKRPNNHPLIVHIADIAWADDLALSLNATEKALMKKFWPGPMTLVTVKNNKVPDRVTAQLNTVAIRYSKHPLFNEIIKRANVPLAAPSANPFTTTSPTQSQHVETLFNGKIPVVDGGACDIGIESTILRVNDSQQVEILRPGFIDEQQLIRAGFTVKAAELKNVAVSGNMKVHYRPKKNLQTFKTDELADIIKSLKKPCAFLLHSESLYSQVHSPHLPIQMPTDAEAYGKSLYNHWHQLDSSDVDTVYIEKPPQTSEWQYIHDKINKATVN